MKPPSRRNFLTWAGATIGAGLISSRKSLGLAHRLADQQPDAAPADYVLHIAASPIEIAPKRMISTITYNGQFPGPLLRMKEGRPVTVEIHNDTDTGEQLHWHGQKVSTDVDGAAEEGTPEIAAHGMRRITFTPQPAGLRFYHSHNRAGANLYAVLAGRPAPWWIP